MASSPVSFPSSPCSSFLGDSNASSSSSSYSDSFLFRGMIPLQRSCSSASSSSSLRLAERRGRHLPCLTLAMATATSYVEETSPRTLYDVLGVAKEATEKEVRSAYRRLALRFHPDAVPEPEKKEANTKAFLEIHSAYMTLSDEATRSRYDTQISLQSWTKGSTRGGAGGPHATQRSSSSIHVTQPYSSPLSFSYQSSRGRSWETDQCWC